MSTEKKPERRRSSAPPNTIDGITFLCWSEPYQRTTRRYWESEDGRARIQSNFRYGAHNVQVDGEFIWGANGKKAKNFRSFEAAARAAAKIISAGPATQ